MAHLMIELPLKPVRPQLVSAELGGSPELYGTLFSRQVRFTNLAITTPLDVTCEQLDR
jgi:hypothetical protein